MNDQQPKPAPKKTKKTKQIPTPRFDRAPVMVQADFDQLPARAIEGDALVKIDLPSADRDDLARQLVMLAGHVSSMHGDPIEGATILVITKRKKS